MDEQKQKIKKPHKKMSSKLFTGIWGSLLALLMVGIITLNVVLLKYSSLITRSLGHQTVATVNLDTSGDSDYFKRQICWRMKRKSAGRLRRRALCW